MIFFCIKYGAGFFRIIGSKRLTDASELGAKADVRILGQKVHSVYPKGPDMSGLEMFFQLFAAVPNLIGDNHIRISIAHVEMIFDTARLLSGWSDNTL
jgi:hypothetical protein